MASAQEIRRQKKAAKQKAKARQRKGRAQVKRHQQQRMRSAGLDEMARWPLANCYIGSSWHERGARVHAVITRYHEQGRLAVAHFEVDMEDIGVMHASLRSDWQSGEFEHWIGELGETVEPMEVCDAGLVVKMIEAASELNEDFPKGYAEARALCWEIEPEGPDFHVGPEPTEETEKPGTPGLFASIKSRLGF